MSLIIAIRDKDRVVLGADKQMSNGLNKEHTCTKIWEIDELPGAIMGGVGSARANQIIQYSQIIDKNDVNPDVVDTKYIVSTVVPTIVAILKNNGVDCNLKETEDTLLIPNVFLFAYQDKAWMIWNDLSVTELHDYLAIGSGSDVANGALFATPDKNPFERIVTCIDAAAESTLYVDNGIDLLCTEVLEDDAKLADIALGYFDENLLDEFNKFIQSNDSKTTTKKNKKAKQPEVNDNE